MSCSSVYPSLIYFIVRPKVFLQINFTQGKRRVPDNVRSEIALNGKVIVKDLEQSCLMKKQKKIKYRSS
jgi:hypothetical protein